MDGLGRLLIIRLNDRFALNATEMLHCREMALGARNDILHRGSRLTAATRTNGEGALLKHGALVGDTWKNPNAVSATGRLVAGIRHVVVPKIDERDNVRWMVRGFAAPVWVQCAGAMRVHVLLALYGA